MLSNFPKEFLAIMIASPYTKRKVNMLVVFLMNKEWSNLA